MGEMLLSNMRQLGRRLRLGFVGGGEGSRIGATHRYAARLDGKYDIVAGAFDLDPVQGRKLAADLLIDPSRAYDNVEQLIEDEKGRADPVDVVVVLTPNQSHFAVAEALVESGFHVLCEKPMTTTMDDARILVSKVERAGTLLGVNYGYSGYPMIRQAKAMCERGDFGMISLIQIEWALGSPRTMSGEQGGQWRTDPSLVGGSMVLAQLGTHAIHTAKFITGLEIESLSADLATFVPNRQVDDNAQISMRFAHGARGALWTSYVAAGAWNGFKVKIFGDKGGFEWLQEDPNNLLVHELGGERKILTRSGVGATPESIEASRVAVAHPEGFIEAIANIYSDFAEAVAAHLLGKEPGIAFPNHVDGAESVYFIDAAVESSSDNGKWVNACMTEHLN
jgi:predicted dehydrogenase